MRQVTLPIDNQSYFVSYIPNRYSQIWSHIMICTIFFLAVGIGGIVFVRFYKKARKEKSSQYALGEKGYEHIPMATKDSDEDGEGGDSSDSTTTDEHKKMLN